MTVTGEFAAGEPIIYYNTSDQAAPVNVGSQMAVLYVDEYFVAVDYNITKGTPTVTAPTANTLTYNGEVQALVSVGATSFGTMVYSLAEDGEYTTTIPAATNADDYVVYYYVEGAENYNSTAVSSVTVTIAPMTITADMITVNGTVCNGEVQTPNENHVTVVVNGKTLVHNIDYYIGVPSDVEFINAGTYPITIYGDGNYTGSVEAIFTINHVR